MAWAYNFPFELREIAVMHPSSVATDPPKRRKSMISID